MGLLDGNALDPFLTMLCDVYYATETQDRTGALIKSWTFDRSVKSELYMLDKISDRNNFTFDDPEFYRINNMLRGRAGEDIRKDATGIYHPLSHILVTNVRTAKCEEESVYISTNGEYEGKPIIYAVSTCNPFVGLFGKVEYHKVTLKRADNQGILG